MRTRKHWSINWLTIHLWTHFRTRRPWFVGRAELLKCDYKWKGLEDYPFVFIMIQMTMTIHTFSSQYQFRLDENQCAFISCKFFFPFTPKVIQLNLCKWTFITQEIQFARYRIFFSRNVIVYISKFFSCVSSTFFFVDEIVSFPFSFLFFFSWWNEYHMCNVQNTIFLFTRA